MLKYRAEQRQHEKEQSAFDRQAQADTVKMFCETIAEISRKK